MLPPAVRLSIGGLVAVGAIALVAAIGASGSGDASPVSSAQAAGSARPRVAFASPRAGATVSGKIRVRATVSAKPRISRVEFRVDGKLKWTDRKKPFVMNGDKGTLATSSLKVGAHTLTVTAIATNGSRRSVTRTIKVRRARRGAPASPGAGAAPAAPPAAAPVPTSASAPNALRLGLATQNGLGFVWDPSPGAVAYGVYLNGQKLAEVPDSTYTFGALSCGVTYRVLVELGRLGRGALAARHPARRHLRVPSALGLPVALGR